MMKNFFFAFVFFSATELSAQDPQVFAYHPSWPLPDSSLRECISVSSEYAAASDALTNSFIDKFYQGGFIDSSMKAEQGQRLLPSNRFGAYSGFSVSCSWRPHPDSLKWEYLVAVRDRQSLFGKFSDDAFHLALEGNRSFLGSTADVGNTKFTLIHWQQIQFEAKYYSPDKRSQMVLGISFLNGQQFQEANIRSGKLFTSSDGTFIDASADASWYASDTAHKVFGSRNGSGNCFNFRFITALGDPNKKMNSQLMFSVQDLGYIRWNTHSQIYSTDTSIHYTGVDASQAILNPKNVSGVPGIDSLIGKVKNGQVISFLPIGLRGRYTLFLPSRTWMGIDVRIWSYTGASAQFTLFGGWHCPDSKFNISGGASWGGFARLQFPLQVGYTPCKRFSVTVGTINAAGYILPAKTYGQGAYMNLSFGI